MKKSTTEFGQAPARRGRRRFDLDGLCLVRSWETLANFLGFRVRVMSWACRKENRSKLVEGFMLGGRNRYVYRSLSPLCFIQKRLGKLFSILMKDRPDEDVAIAYRKRVNPAEALEACTNYNVMVATDIRHYYDNVTRRHIVETLEDCGLRGRGTRLIANLCCVDRKVERDGEERTVTTLQQGSPASPSLSNLVGNRYFDVPILEWLRENVGTGFRYVRYCDNIVAFFDSDDRELLSSYRNAVVGIAKAGGFRTHNWDVVRNDDGHRRQQFLGMCLNRVVNLPKWNRDRLRATLFNVITKDPVAESKRLLRDASELHEAFEEKMLLGRAASVMSGYASYAGMVNAKFGMQLKKLQMVLDRMLDGNLRYSESGIADLKTYVRADETPETFMERVERHLVSA